MTVSRWILRSLVAAISTGTVAGSALVPSEAHAATEDDAKSNNESAVFSRFSDLADEETEKRLAEFSKDEKSYEAMRTINKLLASGASAKELEAYVLTLVAKRTTEDADVSLAAVMLDYYETFLRDDLADGSLQPSEVFKEMIAQDEVLSTAAYGSGSSSYTYPRKTTRR